MCGLLSSDLCRISVVAGLEVRGEEEQGGSSSGFVPEQRPGHGTVCPVDMQGGGISVKTAMNKLAARKFLKMPDAQFLFLFHHLPPGSYTFETR